MHRTIRFILAAAPLILAGAAHAQEPRTEELSVAVSDAHGSYIADAEGYPLYTMLTDRNAGDNQDPLQSCHEVCRESWPLLKVEDSFEVDDTLDPDLARVINWRGSRVAAYADRALFRFHRDQPGQEPQGQGVFSFGGYWALLSPSGVPIESDAMPEPRME